MGFVKWTPGIRCNSVWTAVGPYPFCVILSFVCKEHKNVGQNNLLRKLGLDNFTLLVSKKQGKWLFLWHLSYRSIHKNLCFLIFQTHVCCAKCLENLLKLSNESWTRTARLHIQTLLSPVSYKQTNPTSSSDQKAQTLIYNLCGCSKFFHIKQIR